MSVSHIPEKVKIRLWGKAAGRCQYEGCNKPLWYDSLTKAEFNISYIAHIIADQPGGPRGHETLSEELKDDISNLMLMCDEHHRLIDREDVKGHPVQRLRQMKAKHESRIELLGSLQENVQSHVILYGANVGEHNSNVSWEKATPAMVPCWYPAEKSAIVLGVKNSMFEDYEPHFWLMEIENLKRQFEKTVKTRLNSGELEHISIFALAPQPLLIELGRLFSDIPTAEVYQLHREPANWAWQEHPSNFDYLVHEPEKRHTLVAVNLSLSATIENSRIISILGEDVSIWTLTIGQPYNEYLKSREQLTMFRERFRKLLDRIKAVHGQDTIIHLFPAGPVAVAVEIGRIWMPKADLQMIIYDQNAKAGGFIKASELRSEREMSHV